MLKASGINSDKPLRVVWVCSFDSNLFKEELQIGESQSLVTWITYLIGEIKTHKEVELHVITTNSYIKEDISFEKEGIHYYFIKRNDFSFIPGPIHRRLVYPILLFRNFNTINNKIVRLINKIKPDIVNTHGTEDVNSLCLNRLNIPSVIWIQGLINTILNENSGYALRKGALLEERVFRKQKNYITGGVKFIEDALSEFNSNANFFPLYYPISKECFTLTNEKDEYGADIVFVGRMVKAKGIFDVIEVANLVKNEYPDIRVKLVGAESPRNMERIKALINKYQLNDNIVVTGFLPDHLSVLNEVIKSKIFLLPTYNDTGPRSVAESMALGVPIVSYNIGGLPSMIENNYSGILVDVGNIDQLAKAIIYLLGDENQRKLLSLNAKNYAKNHFQAKTIVENLIKVYHKIIGDYGI